MTSSAIDWRHIIPNGTKQKTNVDARQAHDVNITSPQRRCNVMTLHRRWGDVIFTWRKYNVASTSMQRHDVASTLRRRYIYVMCIDVEATLYLRYVHDVNITSPQRRCNVMTLHRRWGDVIFTSCARWVMHFKYCLAVTRKVLRDRYRFEIFFFLLLIKFNVFFYLLTLVLLNQDILCLFEQCRSRSVGF